MVRFIRFAVLLVLVQIQTGALAVHVDQFGMEEANALIRRMESFLEQIKVLRKKSPSTCLSDSQQTLKQLIDLSKEHIDIARTKAAAGIEDDQDVNFAVITRSFVVAEQLHLGKQDCQRSN